MARAFLFVLDSFGIGAAPDAARFGDEGADTYGHIRDACVAGAGDRAGLRAGPLALPNMARLGLDHAWALAHGAPRPAAETDPDAFFGAATETSSGKDTPSGHWEIAGVPVTFEWGYFPDTVPAFPTELTDAIVAAGELPGLIGNRHASGTSIVEALGAEHVATGKPIIYTSVDSVIQFAAHEEAFGLERLYDLCRAVRPIADRYNIGRVIARPFVGDDRNGFRRTANRRDFAVPPPEPTVADRLEAAGRRVIGIGKIGDIFAHRGITETRKAAGNMALFDAALGAMDDAGDGDLVFANFVDFDTEFGHRRDVPGYAEALEAFDRRLPDAMARLRPGDLLLLTADHGCDPTFRGTDHTRERVPIIGLRPGGGGGAVGVRETYADIAATIAVHLGLDQGAHGTSFLRPAGRGGDA